MSKMDIKRWYKISVHYDELREMLQKLQDNGYEIFSVFKDAPYNNYMIICFRIGFRNPLDL